MKRPTAVAAIELGKDVWQLSSKGKFLLVEDPRGLRQIYHPWDISEDGDFAMLAAHVTIPVGWAGHRFKQVLVDDRVVWGDVALSSGAPVPWEENPARKAPRLDPVRLAAAKPVESATGTLTLNCPNGLPDDGYPVTWGIPFGMGRLLDGKHVSVVDPDGRSAPLQTQVLHKWPDDSVHWLLLDFQAAGKHAGGTYTVRYGTSVARKATVSELRVAEADDAVTVDTGASYGIAPYHTGVKPHALNAPLSGLFILHYLTGDPDARGAAVGIADWLHATNQGLGAGSGRAVGWPLRSTVIAYENTYDPKHLELARKLVGYALQAKLPRRDVFSETPSTWQYRGGMAGMNTILAAGLMHYWRATGDEAITEVRPGRTRAGARGGGTAAATRCGRALTAERTS